MIALINAFALIAVDSGFGPRSDQNWYLLLLSQLRSKSKDWLPRNQNNVSEWSDIFYQLTVISGSLHYKDSIKPDIIAQSGYRHYFIACNLFSPT